MVATAFASRAPQEIERLAEEARAMAAAEALEH